jgi:predicted transcriptional regulator
MVNLQITEEADAVLETAAKRAGLSKEEFAEEIILAHMEDESLPLSAFTEEQLARFKESIAQLDRGEGIPGEEVMQKLDRWIVERASR